MFYQSLMTECTKVTTNTEWAWETVFPCPLTGSLDQLIPFVSAATVTGFYGL